MLLQKIKWLLSLLTILATVYPVRGDLLFKPGEPYVNYAYEGYRAYESLIFGRTRTPQFDNLGQFVMNGVSVFELKEYRTIDPVSGSIITKPRLYQSYLNRLVIAGDSYSGVNTKFIIGDRIRAKFTSFTLDMAAMNGMRMDSDFDGGSVVLLASRIDKPIFEAVQNADNGIHGDEKSEFRPRWSTYLLGGDVRTKHNNIDFGFSWVNQYRTDSFKSLDQSSYKGTLPTTGRPPQWIVAQVSDETPGDIDGVQIRKAVMTVNGVAVTHTLGPYDNLQPSELRLTVTEHVGSLVVPPIRRDNSNELVVEFPHVAPSAQGLYEVRGSNSTLFWFRVPSLISENNDTLMVDKVSIDFDIAGDYQIELAEVFDGASANPATYFYSAANAMGSPSGEHFERVKVNYGRQTGRTLLGTHFNLDFKGFLLRSEYVHNLSFRAYPSLITTKLRHLTQHSNAFFAALKRDWSRFSMGAEVFNVATDYSTELSVQDDDFRSYFQFLTSPYIYPTNFHEPRLPDLIENERPAPTNTIEFNSVDDNDDKDPFPDSNFLRKTTNLVTGGRYIEDPDGVFPGLDSDLNGRPDINENDNRIPDYYEPFLLYRVNPDAYDYGEDMNNNGVIDEREDDDKPDYPYNVGERGWNFFGQFRPNESSLLTLGTNRTSALSQGTEAKMTYLRFEWKRRLPYWVKLEAVGRTKRVLDNVADRVFGLGRNPIYLEPEPVPLYSLTDEAILNPLGIAVMEDDPLLMRDSWVNTFFAKANFIRYENFFSELSIKKEFNQQTATLSQAENLISDLAVVFKADYKWNPWRQLIVWPQVKWLHQNLVDEVGKVASVKEDYFFPIIRFEYPVSDRTSLKIGAQGLPFLSSIYRNRVSNGVDFDDEVYLAQVSNTSVYLGYQVNVNLGYERRFRSFLDEGREAQDIDYSRIFLRIIAGLRPLF
ncbi:MAG: hypothetical protein VX294_12880 [Candidatus Latescibacterota bacterium]|nr:hypothetical protein [Candidatus Latescibacterota bacterium]